MHVGSEMISGRCRRQTGCTVSGKNKFRMFHIIVNVIQSNAHGGRQVLIGDKRCTNAFKINRMIGVIGFWMW